MATTTTRNIPSNLPEVDFVDVDTEALTNKLIAGYEEITGRTLYPADPVRAFILWLASVIIQERVQINESAKQNLPRYAVGENLDSLSEIFHNTYRLEPTAATTTLRFYITTTLQEDYIITDQLEVTVDGIINFATNGYIKFKAGENYADVEAICQTIGTTGNGFTPGQINKLISDEFLYFKEVANITTTAGGSEEEEDTAFYNRMRESEESYTTAGPRGSYKYHAKTVSSLISDVSAESTEDGIADIRIMLYGGELPDEELIAKVQAYLSADDIRPMTDKVVVSAPTTIPFNINATYYISGDKVATTQDIKNAVEAATENYILWQTQKMGRDINPSYFNAMLMESGIKRVEITEPLFTNVPKGSVAVIGTYNVTFGGVEDE
ncbi:MAG: baseplate J/gp47 family protein [Paludibacter sp.]|nr:baseplate J/gp47 family protein [Paludibacter sp.]